MSAIRAKNTRPELIFRRALQKAGIRGYRLHSKKVPGKPDICFQGKKIAIFVHGCFWHRCPYCKLIIPKTHKGFWNKKFCANKLRDKRKSQELTRAGFHVIEIWECRIKKNTTMYVDKVKSLINRKNDIDNKIFNSQDY